MTKKIRFPLDMGNGVEVRTLEELQENFSLEKVLGYYADGKLITWLRDRYMDDVADALEKLDKDMADFSAKVCEIFNVEYSEGGADIKTIEERKQRLVLLKEYTEEQQFIDVIDDIAFDQDNLYDLLDEDKTTIYLCGEKFSIPLSKTNMKYIGINEPMVVISTKESTHWEEKQIEFVNVRIEDENANTLLCKTLKDDKNLIDDFCQMRTDGLVQRLEKEIESNGTMADRARYMLYQLYHNVPQLKKDIQLDVRRQLEKAAKNGYVASVIRFTLDYHEAEEEVTELCEKFCEDNKLYENDVFLLYEMGVVHSINKNYSISLDFFEDAAESGLWLAEREIAFCYERGEGVDKDVIRANKWHEKVAQKGLTSEYFEMACNCIFGLQNEMDIGKKYLEKMGEDQAYLDTLKEELIERIDNIPIVKYYRPISIAEVREDPWKYQDPFWESEGSRCTAKALDKFQKEYMDEVWGLGAEIVLLKYAEKQLSNILTNIRNYYVDNSMYPKFLNVGGDAFAAVCDLTKYSPVNSDEVLSYGEGYYEKQYLKYSEDVNRALKNQLRNIVLGKSKLSPRR